MNMHATISEADERALLDSIDRWLTKKVAPVAANPPVEKPLEVSGAPPQAAPPMRTSAARKRRGLPAW